MENIRFALRTSEATAGQYYVVDTESDTIVTFETTDHAFAVRQLDWLNATYAPGADMRPMEACTLSEQAARRSAHTPVTWVSDSPQLGSIQEVVAALDAIGAAVAADDVEAYRAAVAHAEAIGCTEDQLVDAYGYWAGKRARPVSFTLDGEPRG